MTELTRGEKIRQTMIKNIQKEYGGISKEQADKIRITRMKAAASRGGKNGTGHSFGHGLADPRESGRKGGQNRWRKREPVK